MSFISYLLDSKVLIRNIIIQVSYGETYLGKAYELFKQMENLGIEVKKYYISDFSCDGEPIYNYDSSKTPITMIIEDTLYSNFENEYKYIFLHIPKTSGTGLRNYLGNTQRYFFSHKSILEYRDHNQNTFNEFFKFAIVRNPWDRFVSQFFYDNKLRIELNYDKAEVNKASIMGKATFRDAVLALRDNKIIADSQHEWICDENGNILVDYVGRFEKLAESYEYIAKKIGIYTGKPIAKVNASKHKPYQECYDEESKEIVSQYFKKDIELFGYTFD